MTLVLAMFSQTGKKAEVDKRNYIKLKNLCASKEIVTRVKRQSTTYCGRKYSQTTYQRRDLFPKYMRKFYNSIAKTNKKT